jgi:tryptophan synthase alpha chain
LSHIAARFARCQAEGRKGFIPFITAGDPDLETTRALIVELAGVGATLIELGVPFSDPMAEVLSSNVLQNGQPNNPVWKRSSKRRPSYQETDTPLVLFSYFNPLLRWHSTSG